MFGDNKLPVSHQNPGDAGVHRLYVSELSRSFKDKTDKSKREAEKKGVLMVVKRNCVYDLTCQPVSGARGGRRTSSAPDRPPDVLMNVC